ncbi:hypothetical protein Taro_029299 [Colocasia esculenta]|uniref:Uncharacterized protein n=1 Tax=Colocasia esculenta TaxID=4460 RepID=A0A843VQR7_COLES|nr:hypothetical protein [Colocasia esculenta]
MAISSLSSLLPRTLIQAMAPAAGTRYPSHLRLFFPSKPHRHPLKTLFPSTSGSPLLPAISAIHFEDLVEKDWSFLDADPADSDRARRADRAIAAAEVGEKSRVLACLPTAGFVDRLVETAPCELVLANHESLLVLAEIKERHDAVRCWQGGVEAVPERFSPLDAVFICYLPAMSVTVNELLGMLARRCSPGARVVISCEEGREGVERVHRQQHPDMVTSDLPNKQSLEKAAADNSFQMSEFIDEPSFYLAVLKFCR